MLTDVGPGVIPHQFALVSTPSATTLSPWYWAIKYVRLQTLQTSGWETRDPVFYEMCNGPRPQGAMELSWLSQQVLTGAPNQKLPSIPRNQLRYISAYAFAVIASNVASLLERTVPVFECAAMGAASGVGVTDYGPVELPLELALADIRGRRELYTTSLSIQSPASIQQQAQAHQQGQLNNYIEAFTAGGVVLHLSYQPLISRGHSQVVRTADVFFPIHILRVVLRSQAGFARNCGRLAALI